jgi:hypothetical protein
LPGPDPPSTCRRPRRFQANALGWKIPTEDNTMPMHQYLANYLPPEHAYSFSQYKYDLEGKVRRAGLSRAGCSRAGQAAGGPSWLPAGC